MKKLLYLSILFLFESQVVAQTKILPGDKSINFNLIKEGSSSMEYYVLKNGKSIELGSYDTNLRQEQDQFVFTSTLNFLNSDKKWTETICMNKSSLKSISRKSSREKRTFNIEYANTIKGEYFDVAANKKTKINFSVNEPYFDIATYPVILCSLPLVTGYKVTIPVLDYDSANKDKIQNVIIAEVKSNLYNSELTGNHEVWKVHVKEESSGNDYDYFIDKVSRKIYKIIISSKGNTLMLINKENNFNPSKNRFDKEANLKMITKGKSVIIGEAFAKDDRSGRDDKKFRIDILNINKKQFPPKGTKVYLIPYTEYFKEWLELNKKQRKVKGAKPIPLIEDAKACVLETEIYDDKGNFEFTNLTEGEYYVSISFSYQDYYSTTEVTGTSDVYVNGQYVGTQLNTDVFGHTQNGNANFQKIVKIKTDGETVKIKLKRY